MAEISYGSCQKCTKIDNVFTVHQYTKSNSLTTKGKKYFCICYNCSDELIIVLNNNAKKNPQDFIPVPFDSVDPRKNAKIILSNAIYENNIFELVNDHLASLEEVEEGSEVEVTEPVDIQRPSLKLIDGGGRPARRSVPGSLPKYSAQEIFEKLTKRIIGQDDAIRTISIATERYLESLKDTNVKKINLLITGKTAMGKTASVNALQEIIDIPVLSYNMKHFTSSGYVGKDVSEIVNQACEITGNPERPRAIILLDEIDKLGVVDSTESFIRTDVYYELLTMIEGGRAVISGKKNTGEASKNVDTSELFFILAGSFHKITDKKVEKGNYRPVGLGKKDSNVVQLKPEHMTPNITNEDLLASGMPHEFIGRIHVRVPFRTLSELEYIDVIKKSSDSPLKSYLEYFKKRNVEIEFSDAYLADVAKIVSANGLGVRGIIEVFEKDLKHTIFNNHEYSGATVIVGSGGKIEKTSEKKQLRQ